VSQVVLPWSELGTLAIGRDFLPSKKAAKNKVKKKDFQEPRNLLVHSTLVRWWKPFFVISDPNPKEGL
jgi:hypothetical protein